MDEFHYELYLLLVSLLVRLNFQSSLATVSWSLRSWIRSSRVKSFWQPQLCKAWFRYIRQTVAEIEPSERSYERTNTIEIVARPFCFLFLLLNDAGIICVLKYRSWLYFR